ncbi:hypothetical protein GCM10023336_39840 [Streptomyces similanensis]|uniref:Secreted protein n=1 Tax=Streptomyces similanensis TaxID=1274988 RepID=A0ABP9KQU0_9ACTN
MFAVLYVLASSPVPSAAACNTWRISPVARDTTVPTAISKDERAGPPSFFVRRAACRPLVRCSCGMVRAAEFAPSTMPSIYAPCLKRSVDVDARPARGEPRFQG